jgi:NAD(P)-dependent dehydrogenase (short-subunit alcohol dehydrogenase family)
MTAGLEGKVALVTGAASGIGLATMRSLVAAGARAVGLDRQLPRDKIEGASWVEIDLSRREEIGGCLDTILAREERADILVHSAGICRDAVSWKMTDSQWDDVLEVNLTALFGLVRHLTPTFRKQGAGRVVAVSSINGLRGKFGQANYAASKAGLVGLVKTLARELGAFGVNVNAVAPGMIETPMTGDLPAEVLERSLTATALGRLGRPEDVADVILFLCSQAARYVTGEVIRVDGGQSLG